MSRHEQNQKPRKTAYPPELFGMIGIAAEALTGRGSGVRYGAEPVTEQTKKKRWQERRTITDPTLQKLHAI